MSTNVRYAISFILLAALSDGLDGVLARKNKNGKLGEYMDIGADLVSFCIAPSVILYNNSLYSGLYFELATLICMTVFVVSGFIRLTSFPLIKKRSFFVGLPTPTAGLIVSLLVFVKIDLIYILFVLILLSFLMVTNLKFPKIDFKSGIVATVLIFLVIIFGRSWYNIMPILLLLSLTVYIITGFFITLKKGS
jgi:CDP-diacylglycerol--serine O-phosphatidyltransferase